MLPNLKIVIGGILVFVLLLAVTGAGIVTPLTYTRIGTTPEVSHPMMQRVFAEDVAAPALNAAVLARRQAELDALRELAPPAAVFEPPTEEDEPDAIGTVKSPDRAAAAEIAAAPAGMEAKPPGRDAADQSTNTIDAELAPPSPAMSVIAAASAGERTAQPVAASPDDKIAAPSAPEPAKAVIPEASGNAEKLASTAPQPAAAHHRAAAVGSKKATKSAARRRKPRFHKAPQPAPESTQSPAYAPFGQSFQPSYPSYYQPSPSPQTAANANRVSRRVQ